MAYNREQLSELYKSLPEDLKDILGSEKTIDLFESLSNDHNLSNEQTKSFTQLTREAILGLLPPGQFTQALIDAARINKTEAEKINIAVHRFIFFPVKESLSVLYETPIAPPAGMLQETIKQESASAPTEKRRPSPGKDTYRESIK